MSIRPIVVLMAAVSLAQAETDPARLPRKPRYAPPAAVEGQIILIGHKDAPKPLEGATRSKEEALALALRVTEEARQKGARFDDLVKKYSEDPYQTESHGTLGVLPRGTFPVSDVEDALFAMEEGQVSDPVETPSGYVVATRLGLMTCASHVVVAWKGCRGAKGVRRSKEEARARALELRKRIVEEGEDFAKVARKESDSPSSLFAGHLGFLKRGTMPYEFDAVAFSLAPGEVSEPVETESGYHLIQARAFVEASHILIGFKEAKEAIPGATRTRAEAQARIEQALARIRAGEDFRAVAREMSECPSAVEDGHLPPYEPGQSGLVQEYEGAANALRAGELSGVVESPFGFHLILRWR